MEHNELSKVENAEIRFHRRDRRERGDEDRVEEGASTQRQQRSPRMKNNEFSRVHNPSSNLRPCRAARVTGLMDVWSSRIHWCRPRARPASTPVFLAPCSVVGKNNQTRHGN